MGLYPAAQQRELRSALEKGAKIVGHGILNSTALNRFWERIANQFEHVGQVQSVAMFPPDRSGAMPIEVLFEAGNRLIYPFSDQNHMNFMFKFSVVAPTNNAEYFLPRDSVGDFVVHGLRYADRDGSGRRYICIFMERPIERFDLPRGTLDRVTVEFLHLQRFCSDHLIAHGVNPYPHRILPRNPPHSDFLVDIEPDKSIGVDCVQFAIEQSKMAHALFGRLKKDMARRTDDRALSGLRGQTVFLGFGVGEKSGLPPKSWDSTRMSEELLSELALYAAGAKADQPSQSEIGEDRHPNLHVARTRSGVMFYSAPGLFRAPSSFAVEHGFEVALLYDFTLNISDEWERLRLLIEGHDNPGFDHLLVSIGAPDRDGVFFPAAVEVFWEMLRFPEEVRKPKYVRRVYLHEWGSGRIFLLDWRDHPTQHPTEINGAIRQPWNAV